jgi:hypothetical protein
MAEEEEYEEDEDDVSQNKAVVNNENKEPTPEKIVEQKSEDKKDTHSKKSKGKSSKIIKASKSNDNAYKLPKPEHVESTRSFLESTVTTAIQEALLELARKRDEIQDPLTFVGEYLIKKAKEKNQ